MFDGRFLGFADFLVLDGDAYADVLGRDGVPIHDGVELGCHAAGRRLAAEAGSL